mgnify:CR=1 FL=1
MGFFSSERRKWTRVKKRIRINAIVIDSNQKEGLFRMDAVWTKDIGGNGLGLVTRAHCVVGSAIDVNFHLPGQEKAIEAKGRVVWSKLDEEVPGEYRIGVAFETIGETDRQTIMHYVESEAKKETQGL